MLLFYIDESGHHRMGPDPADDKKLAPDTTAWFVLSAVGIRDTSRRPLAEGMTRIKQLRLGQDSGSWNTTEIKGRRLAITRRRLSLQDVDARADYAGIENAEGLDALEQDLARLFSRFRPLVYTVAIDKQRLFTERPGESALGWAYAFLYRRIAHALERIYPGEGGALVADQQTEHENAFRTGELTQIRDLLAAQGKHKVDYRALLDRPLWVDSGLSTWDREIIQLADLVAFTTHEGMTRGFSSAAARPFWPAIHPVLAENWMTGGPNGAGLVIFPQPRAGDWPDTRPNTQQETEWGPTA